MGVGQYVGSYNNVPTPEYNAWSAMLARCYDPNTQFRQPSYVGCTVDPIWHNFQNFAHWYVSNLNYGKGWQLDKDILFNNNRLYSEHTCCLVPGEINRAVIDRITNDNVGTVLRSGNIGVKCGGIYIGTYNTKAEAINAYYQARMLHLTNLADKWKRELDPMVYAAILRIASSN